MLRQAGLAETQVIRPVQATFNIPGQTHRRGLDPQLQPQQQACGPFSQINTGVEYLSA